MDVREIVRILMWQVREEQQLRLDAVVGKTSRVSMKPPNDVEVDQRIGEVQELLKRQE